MRETKIYHIKTKNGSNFIIEVYNVYKQYQSFTEYVIAGYLLDTDNELYFSLLSNFNRGEKIVFTFKYLCGLFGSEQIKEIKLLDTIEHKEWTDKVYAFVVDAVESVREK